MALRIQHISPLFSNSSVTLFAHKLLNTRISCTGPGGGSDISDAALASEFAAKTTRINAQLLQTEEAMRKSRKLLFGELCEFMGLKEDEAQQKWNKMGEDEKWTLVKRFVSEWGSHFHPLSARSTKEMVEEYLRQGNSLPNSTSSVLFPGFWRMIGFP